jgi:hypothetical protein
MWSSVVSGGESDMGKLLLCATVLTGTAAASLASFSSAPTGRRRCSPHVFLRFLEQEGRH